MDRAAVERFVRETLGCGCPDEVFRDLRLEPADRIHDGAIHVGGRLLVLLLRPDGAREFEHRLAVLMEAGRQRRDSAGYNRVRFVLATTDSTLVAVAERIFAANPWCDERTHLHVVAPAAVPF
jgi:hypothetical protein